MAAQASELVALRFAEGRAGGAIPDGAGGAGKGVSSHQMRLEVTGHPAKAASPLSDKFYSAVRQPSRKAGASP